MALVNYSIPLDLKKAFDKAFHGRNKSAIVAQLMRDAIEAEHDDESTSRAVNALRMLRATAQLQEDASAARPTPRRRR
jgi:hypothetical protein